MVRRDRTKSMVQEIGKMMVSGRTQVKDLHIHFGVSRTQRAPTCPA